MIAAHSNPLCPAAELAELPNGTARGFPVHGVFVLRHAGQLHAYRDACPHDGRSPLPWRRDAYFNADRSRIVCAAHGAQFEPDTGLCVLGPCLGQRLTRVPLSVDARGDAVVTPACAEDRPAPSTPQPFQETHP